MVRCADCLRRWGVAPKLQRQAEPVARCGWFVRCCIPCWLAVSCVLGVLLTTASAQDDSAENGAIPLWQLERGQTFQVQSTIRRVSEILVGDVRSTSDVTDRVTLQYVVFGHDRRGGAQLQVRIKSLSRTTARDDGDKATESLSPEESLSVPGVAVVVRNQGASVQVLGGQSLFRDEDSQTHRVLMQMTGDGVYASWFDFPFRVPLKTERPPFRVPGSNAERAQNPVQEKPEDLVLRNESAWSRTHEIALGLAGRLRGECNYQIETIEDDTATLTMIGTLHQVPVQTESSDALRYHDFQVASTEISGEGRLRIDRNSGLPSLIEMKQQMSIEAEAHVVSAGQTHPMTFKQSLTQTWIASEFTVQTAK